MGGQSTEDIGFQEVYKLGHNRVHPLTIPKTMANAGASHISMEFGITGPSFTISTACSSAGHAIGQAFWMVRTGATDLAIAGGSEAPFSFGILKAWEAMRVVSPETCRPFSKDRRGMILGEGGAMLVLEPLEAARARGARIHAEIVGFGMSADACHITQPSAEGAARAMRAALRDAGLAPEQIGYINAHGTATPANDPTEVAAIRSVFGPHAERLAISSTKSMHGHALGAAAALECLAAALALRDGVLPPTANFNEPDPAVRPGRDSQPRPARAGGVRALQFIRVRRIERRAGAAQGVVGQAGSLRRVGNPPFFFPPILVPCLHSRRSIPGMTVGIVSEISPGERRVAMVPGAIAVLNKTGAQLLMEAGAGLRAGFPDAEYAAKGVRIANSREEVFQRPSGGRRCGRRAPTRRPAPPTWRCSGRGRRSSGSASR